MRPRLLSSLLLLCGLSAAGAGTGCFSPGPPPVPRAAQFIASERPLSQTLPAPTKDEVALVDGRAFSISGFLAIRARLKNHATAAVIWVGTGSLAIQNATRARGRELEIGTAVDIARYALGELTAAEADSSLHLFFERGGLPPAPEEVRKEIDQLLSSAIVRRNERVLASLNQP